MATTTIGNLLLRMEVQGDRRVLTALQRVERRTTDTSRSVRNFGSSANSAKGFLGGFNISLKDMIAGFAGLKIISWVTDALGYFIDKLKSGIKAGFEYNTNLEYTTAAIEALVGSEKLANKMTEKMIILAAETPFQIQHYAKAAKTLLSYGVAQEEILPTMEMLGNVSGGNASAFDKLALAFGQTTAKGKLQAEEVRQMINQGFSPLQWIVKATGIKMEDLQAKMKKGEITTKMVTDALKLATGETGRYGDVMEKLSKTYKGQKEKIEEYGNMFWGKVTKPLQDFISSNVFPILLDGIKKLTKGVDIVYGKLGKVIPKVVDFFKAFKSGDPHKIYESLKKLIPKPLKKHLFDVYVLTLKFRDALSWLKDKAKKAYDYLKKNTKKAFNYWLDKVKKDVVPVIKDVIDKLKKIDLTKAKEGLKKIEDAFIKVEPYLKWFAKWLIDDVVVGMRIAWEAIKSWVDNIEENLPMVESYFAAAIDGIRIILAVMKGDFDGAWDATKSFFSNTKDGSDSMRKTVTDNTLSMGGSVVNGIADMNINSGNIFGYMTGTGIKKSIEMGKGVKSNTDDMRYKSTGFIASLKDVSDTKFDGMKTNALDKSDKMGKGVKSNTDDMSYKASGFIASLKDVSDTKFEDMKTNAIDDSNEMMTKVGAAISALKSTSDSKFNSLKTNSVNKSTEMRTKVVSAVAALSSTSKSKLDNMKSSISSKWNSMKTTAKNAWTSLKNKIINILKGLVSGVKTKIKKVKEKVDNVKSKIKNAFDFSLYKSGRKLIGSLIDGIKSKFNSLKSAASSAASTISDYIRWFSPTKKGAGKDSDKWIPNLMKMMIHGFKDYRGKLANAASLTSNSIASSLAGTSSSIPGIATASAGSYISSNNSIILNVYADSRTNGRSVGKQLVRELNDLGILTHKGG
jgi:tape measure domain-containing protein